VSLTVAARTSIRPVVHHGRSLGLVGTVQAALMPRRVLIQARRHGHWRLVARARPNRSGRFSIRWRVKARRTRTVRLRAVAPGVARSRPLVIALARR